MATYTVAESEVHDLLSEVMQARHPDLVEQGVTVALLMAHAKEGSPGPALKLHGYPCFAVVKINSLKDRVEGKTDATVEICAAGWADHSEKRKRALLSHELTHLVVCRTKEGVVKFDDAGRPKLKMRLHDLVVGGFTETIEGFGPDAVEWDHVVEVRKRLIQRNLFPAE